MILKRIDKKLVILILVFFSAVFAVLRYRSRINKELESFLPILPTIPTPKPVSPFAALKFEETKEYVEVGKETIYGQDLNKMLWYFYPQYLDKPKISADVQEGVFQKAIEQSIMLQEAEKQGWITLTDEVFNSPTKDYRKRNPLVEMAEEKIKENNLRVVEGRYVSIWFYNIEPPAIGVEEAKKIAYKKLETIRPKLLSGEFTFEEAGWQLYKDPEVANLSNPSSTPIIPIPPPFLSDAGSCYGHFYLGGERYQGISFTFNEELEKRVREMKKGEISEILIGKDGGYEEGQEPYEAFFRIFIVNEIKNGQKPETVSAWLDAQKKELQIEYY